jgi:FAD/FMN-containing dehydrogenase
LLDHQIAPGNEPTPAGGTASLAGSAADGVAASGAARPEGSVAGSHAAGEAAATALTPALVRSLRAVLGDDGVITDPGSLLVYESDGLTAYRARPGIVLLPRDTGETAAAVRLLAAAGVPFVARGAGTGLSGGALALHNAAVISLARMNRILELDAVNRRARVQPGVVNVELSAAAAPHGLYYAPDPSSQTVCTIGGNVAENAGGPHCLKYGTTTNHIAGLTVVLSDGSVVELGRGALPAAAPVATAPNAAAAPVSPSGGLRESAGWPDAAGLDLAGVFIGSEGTFGVATEIVVRLQPLPEAVETILALFDDVDIASRTVSRLIAAGLLPAALEMVDREAIRAVEASAYAAGLPDVAGALVIEFDGPYAAVQADAEAAVELCRDAGARDVIRAADEAHRQRLWYARKKAFGAMGRLAPDVLVQDAVVPRSRLPDVLRRVYEIAAEYELRMCNMFHAGDGNLHPTLVFDRRDADQLRRVEAAPKAMMRVCVDAGGTITGEHGVGVDKREYMDMVFTESELASMCDIRRAFDPLGLANPAKVLPVRTCREWVGPATRRVPEP